MGDIRGISFVPLVSYIRKTYGQEGLDKVFEGLDEDDRKIMSGDFTSLHWYSAKAFVNFIAVLDKVLGKGDYQLCHQTGVKSADAAFKGLYKMFLEFGKPHTIIRRAPMAWKLLNNTGSLELITVEQTYTKVKLSGVEDYNKSYCQHLLGYFYRVLELSGALNVRLKETACRCDGAEYCEFEGNWE